jgi:hypothetical protein
MNNQPRFQPIRAALSALPILALLAYGLLVSSPDGRAARGDGVVVMADPRVELAALLARAAGDLSTPWPSGSANGPPGAGLESRLMALSTTPAARRVGACRSSGLTAEVLVSIFLNRGPWPRMAATGQAPYDAAAIARLPGGPTFLAHRDLFTAGFVDSLVSESRDFAGAAGFDDIYAGIEPTLLGRAGSIENDPTLGHLTARLADFLGEPSQAEPAIVPTHFGPWKAPFGVPVAEGDAAPHGGRIVVVDRAESAGKLTPETSLSWTCVREFSRPTVERLGRANAARVANLAGYWTYLKQGLAATTAASWEDCFNAHLYRAIDLRVRPQEDGVERELRIASALSAGLGMIRALDATLLGYDRGRGFYRRFTDYYPTMLEELAGLEARVRVERPRLGLKVTPTGGGLRIEEILRGHSADGSALKVGDVIVEADGRPVVAEDRLAEIVQSHRIGAVLPVVIERNGATQTIDLALSKGRIEYEFFRPEPAVEAGTPSDSLDTAPTPATNQHPPAGRPGR